VIGLATILVVCVLSMGGLAVAGWVIKVAHSAPNLTQVRAEKHGAPSKIYAAGGTLMGAIYSPEVHYKTKGFPRRLRQATIATEDRRFYQHGALDYEGIVRAAIKDVVHGSTALQGASTLTMQLVDNEYLPRKYRNARAAHDLKYKIVQAKLAEQLEAKHSKNWILDGYLNNVPYGTVGNQTAYGAGAASWMFFDRPVSKLTLVQSALLAGLPQAPSEYNPFKYPRAARIRRAHVLGSMVRAGYITQAQASRAERARLEVKHDAPDNSHLDPYVFNYIEQQAAYDLCPKHPKYCPTLTNGGLKIKTTINLHDQAIATQSLRDHASLFAEVGGPGVGGGLASVNALNGDIEAIATSGDYSRTKVNYATSAMRQTGSAFKVFVLMELIHDFHGDPNTTYYDSKPLEAGWLPEAPTWSVHTDDYAYNGSINIATATWLSDNTVFAQLSADLGNVRPGDKLDALAHEMGITSTLTGNPSEVLGGLKYGTTPLQMADAYATIADGGVHHTPTIISKIIFPDGSVRDFGHPKGHRVFSYGETYAADQVLEQVLTHPGATAYGSSYGCPAAGKTGTAENLENAWFVGYSPHISTAVWVGNPTGTVPMGPDAFGGTLAAPVWKQYMESTDGGYCGDWTAPSEPFSGTAYTGPHSSVAPAPPSYGPPSKSKPGKGTGAGNTGTGAGNTGTGAGNTGTGAGNTGTGAGNTGTGAGAGAGATGTTGGASPTG
jgi:penicillin-binding protein 1A